MRPKDTKQVIDQLIGDIQKNEWYCLKGDIENELEYWEKNLIVIGLRDMLFGTDSKEDILIDINQIIDTLDKHSPDETSELGRAISSAIELLKKEVSRNEVFCGAKLCPFCAGKATIQPEGDYWEITCNDCGVYQQGSTYEEAMDAWNLRRL